MRREDIRGMTAVPSLFFHARDGFLFFVAEKFMDEIKQ